MSEREKFEAWAKSEGVDTWKTPSDEYLLFMTRTCYSAWQAAKAESAAEIAALRTELEEVRKDAERVKHAAKTLIDHLDYRMTVSTSFDSY